MDESAGIGVYSTRTLVIGCGYLQQDTKDEADTECAVWTDDMGAVLAKCASELRVLDIDNVLDVPSNLFRGIQLPVLRKLSFIASCVDVAFHPDTQLSIYPLCLSELIFCCGFLALDALISSVVQSIQLSNVENWIDLQLISVDEPTVDILYPLVSKIRSLGFQACDSLSSALPLLAAPHLEELYLIEASHLSIREALETVSPTLNQLTIDLTRSIGDPFSAATIQLLIDAIRSERLVKLSEIILVGKGLQEGILAMEGWGSLLELVLGKGMSLMVDGQRMGQE